MHRRLLPLTCLLALLVIALAACAAPGADPDDLGPALPEQSPPPPAGPADPATEQEPPQRLTRAGAGSGAATLDYSCSSDSDCAVKNVGNCCGYYPACVNKDSPTNPEAVQAQCAKEGRMGVCGFPSIQSCQCVQGRCEGSNRMLESL